LKWVEKQLIRGLIATNLSLSLSTRKISDDKAVKNEKAGRAAII